MDITTDLDIVEINRRLTAYLNGQQDSKWEVIFSPLYTAQPSKCQEGIGFAEAYERTIVKLREVAKTEPQTIESVSTFEEWEQTLNPQDRNNFLQPVFELRDFVRSNFTQEEIFGFYFHGSLSTKDYVPYYSDFDTIVILRKTMLQDEQRLRDFKKRLTKSNVFLYLLDPLQHHGHFVITEYDLQAYNQFLFPLELFKYTTELSLFRQNLEFHVIKSWDKVVDALAKRVEYFRVKWPNDIEKGIFDSYEIKNAIQNILIIPVLYLELKNRQYYYKKFVLESARCDFDSKQWGVIERASKVRQSCQFHSIWPYQLRKFIGYWIHPKLLHFLHRKLDLSITEDMLAIMGQDMLNEARKLTEIMREKLGLRC